MQLLWKNKRAAFLCFVITSTFLVWSQRHKGAPKRSARIKSLGERYVTLEREEVRKAAGNYGVSSEGEVRENRGHLGESLCDGNNSKLYNSIDNVDTTELRSISKYLETFVKSMSSDMFKPETINGRAGRVQNARDKRTEFDRDVDVSELIPANVTHDIKDLDDAKAIRHRFESSQPTFSQEMQRKFLDRPEKLSVSDFHWTVRAIGLYSSRIYTAPKGEMPKRRFPQVVIIGAGKCGTRALLEFLNMHPQVVAARDEIHFFDVEDNFRKGFSWYLSRMKYSYSDQITLEKTPSYMWTQRARDEIYKLNREMKLIAVLKNPVDRVISQALRSKAKNMYETILDKASDGTWSVREYARSVYWSIYVNYVAKWLRKFPISQLHVVDSTMLVKDPVGEVQKVEKFLGIRPVLTEHNFHLDKQKGFYCRRPFYTQDIICLGKGKGMPHPSLPPEVKQPLYEFYRKHNERLFQVIGKRFDWLPK